MRRSLRTARGHGAREGVYNTRGFITDVYKARGTQGEGGRVQYEGFIYGRVQCEGFFKEEEESLQNRTPPHRSREREIL
jgi:hypothetical protein